MSDVKWDDEQPDANGVKWDTQTPATASTDHIGEFRKSVGAAMSRLGQVASMLPDVGMSAVKGANDTIVGTLSTPLNAAVEASNAITGRHDPEPRSYWKEYSDSTIAPPKNIAEQLAYTAAGFGVGAKIPLPGGAPGPTGQLADSLATARGSGYVMPKSAVTGNVGPVEQLMGSKELLADATRRNVAKLSENLTAKQFGLPEGTELTHDAMDAVRANAGKAYEAISSLSPQYASVIEKIKSLRSDAQGYYRQVSANYDHDVAKKADDLWEQAQTLEGQMANNLKPGVTPGVTPNLYEDFVAARRTIAQTHEVDKALINSRGEANPATFSKLYGKEKPITGELLSAGRSAEAFKPAFTTKSGRPFNWPDAALLSSGAGLGYFGMHDPKLLAAALTLAGARYGARKLALSGPVQDMALSSPDQKINALAQALMAAGVANQGTASEGTN